MMTRKPIRTPSRFLVTIALTFALLPMLTGPVQAADPGGTPDTAFSAAVISTGLGFNGDVWSVAVQADNKIVLGGDFTRLNGVVVNHIARLNADGSPDTAFTTAVNSTGDGTGFDDEVWSVAVQANGQILVGGNFTRLNGVVVNRIARLNPDGTPDTVFNTNFGTGAGVNGNVYWVSVQANGQILVGGKFTTLTRLGPPVTLVVNHIARLNPDGTPDTAFTTNTGTGFNEDVWSVAVQANGQILVGGDFTTLNGVVVNRVARLNPDGSPDTAFTTAVNSTVGGDRTGFNNSVYSFALQTSGKIVLGGDFTRLNGDVVNRIARLNPDGTPDTAFTTAVNSTVGGDRTGFSADVYWVAVQADNKIVLGGGFTTLNGVITNRIARLNPDGTPDIAFTTNTGTGFNNQVNSIAVQADGKIVVGGKFTTLNGVTTNNIARLFGGDAATMTDPSTWTTHYQSIPVPASGSCDDITVELNTFAAYDTSVTGGWTKGWEPWVNETLDVNGERIGGWACWRNLVNTGGDNWRINSTP